MAENRVPILLVGLGGVGGKIVQGAYWGVGKEKKQYVGAVCLDTNREDLNKLEGVKGVWIGASGLVIDILNNKHPEFMEWFPSNKYINNRDISTGAGQIRAISRLALALSDKSDHNPLLTIGQEINRILMHNGEVSTNKLYVLIAGSLSGGTCAGSFLQIAFFIREYVKKQIPGVGVSIRGMFLSGDIMEDVQPSVINRNAAKVNAYTCIKELNAFYLTQTQDDAENHLKLDFYVKTSMDRAYAEAAKKLRQQYRVGVDITEDEFMKKVRAMTENGANIPYDSFYLIEGTSNSGSVGNTSLPTIIGHVSKMIFTILFTPIRADVEGVGDNGTLLDMEASGMNRYSSAGLRAIRYPVKEMTEYVTLRWIKKIVGSEWLMLDEACERERKDAVDRQRSDPSVKIPDLRAIYIRMFEDQSRGGEGTRLGAYREDAFVKMPDGTFNKKSRSDAYVKSVMDAATQIARGQKLTNAIEECTVHINLLKDRPEEEISRVSDSLTMLNNVALDTVDTHRYEIANRVFPESFDSLMDHKDDPISVYKFLSGVHPIVARYLVYQVLEMLSTRINTLENSRSIRTETLYEYREQDFDPKEQGIQDAQTALQNTADRKILFVFPASRGEKLSIGKKFAKLAQAQTETVFEYVEKQLQAATCRTLKRRFMKLAELYERFFESIRAQIRINDEKIGRLEHAFDEKPYGEVMVYANEAAFRKTYDEFERKAEFSLPGASKTGIFEGLYEQTCVSLELDRDEIVHQEAEDRMNKKVEKLFEDAVTDKLNRTVRDKGHQILDLSIKDAIGKQMSLEYSILPSEKEFEEKRVGYTRNLINMAFSEAAPMIAVSETQNTSENVYLAMHSDSAELSAGRPNLGATADKLVPAPTQETDMIRPTVLVENNFSRYEFICMKAVHKHVVEHLVKFGPNSEFAQKYRERIADIGKDPKVSGVEAYKEVVTPHLDLYWHEDGYVPPLTRPERVLAHENMLKAFIYSMGMDVFFRTQVTGLGTAPRWVYQKSGALPQTVTDSSKAIMNGYHDLYNALINNRAMVDEILEMARRQNEETRYRLNVGSQHISMADLPFAEDLIQTIPEENDQNLLDIFAGMRRHEYMSEKAWDELFDGLFCTLSDYLITLFDSNELRNEIYQEIIRELLDHSETGKKADSGEETDKVDLRILDRIRELQERRILY